LSGTDRIDAARRAGATALDEPTGKAVLADFGISIPAHRVIHSEVELRHAAQSLRPPFALKLVSSEAIHKSDVGGVQLGLKTAENAAMALTNMKAKLACHGIHPSAWLLEEMIPSGVELVIGGVMDPQFGPLVMVGLGGILVEIMKDVVVRICPITKRDANDMLDELRGAALLGGARGRAAVNRQAIVDALMGVGGVNGLLMRYEHALGELDINPLIATSTEAYAADARIILRPQQHQGE
jgi:acetate---CoA ligase (ADP-forming) subunit beta